MSEDTGTRIDMRKPPRDERRGSLDRHLNRSNGRQPIVNANDTEPATAAGEDPHVCCEHAEFWHESAIRAWAKALGIDVE